MHLKISSARGGGGGGGVSERNQGDSGLRDINIFGDNAKWEILEA